MLESLGLFGLFLISFLASSLYPLGSEAFVLLFLGLDFSWVSVFFVATFGNTLGALSTYFIGFLGDSYLMERFFKKAHKSIHKYEAKIKTNGYIFAFFSFLPFVGDVFVLALGVYRYSFANALIFITLGKAIRYLIVIYVGLSNFTH